METSVLLWDENKVNKWIASIGFSAYERQFKEHGITGDVLVNLDHETLKDLSMYSVGQRLELLKHIYNLKAKYRIPLNEWDYVPPTVLYENDWLGQSGMADYRKIEAAFQERDAHLKALTDDLNRLNMEVTKLREELNHKLKSCKDKKPAEVDKRSYRSGQLLTPPTMVHSGNDYFSDKGRYNDGSASDEKSNDSGAIKVCGEKISNNSKVELESSKNVRLYRDDTCAKVIMSALKKYNVMDDWQQYTLWMQYGPPDNLQERALSYDDKPLVLSEMMKKEAKQNVVFVVKHIKDNKPLGLPPPQLQQQSSTTDNNSSNKLKTPPFTSPRPAPKPTMHYMDERKQQQALQKGDGITSGRIGYEVVVPVMSSSISTPTPSTTTTTATSPATTTSSNNNTSNSNNNDPPKPSLSASSSTRTNIKEDFLSELGLESGIASAIYTINGWDAEDKK